MTGKFADQEISSEHDDSCVQVAVRVRPMLPHEAGNTLCIEVLSSNATHSNVVRLGGASGPKFTFDEVFPLSTSQYDVFEHRVAPLVTKCVQGFNATILAYGQTGSGKTHTIMGPSSSITTSVQDEQQAGVIPRAIRSIFDQLELLREQNNDGENTPENDQDSHGKRQPYEFDVRVQFLEVYGEEIRDLLSTQQPSPKLSIRDVGMEEPEVVGATEHKVESPEEALLCLTRGMYRRVTGATAMNEESSRSHAFLSLIVEQSSVVNDETGSSTDKAMQHVQSKRSKFNFVDLAGSERQKRTKASGQRLKEGIEINKGLLVLGNVISALGDLKKQGKTFVPYRDSKLTRLLKGSLGGNHKTLMMACVSPSSNNMEETLNCLRYANRAKNIQNHAVINMDATSRLVGELQGKVKLLASDLLKARKGNASECTIPLEIVESLANGGDGGPISLPNLQGENSFIIPSPRQFTSIVTQSEGPSPRSVVGQVDGELQKLRAENEVYRMKLESMSDGKDPMEALQQAFTARATEYEREIAILRAQNCATEIAPTRTPTKLRADLPKVRERSESPELSRLRAQVFGSMAQPENLDAEVEAEEKAIGALTTKYLGKNMDDESESYDNGDSNHEISGEGLECMPVQLEAEMYELSNSIGAKEELIQKLLLSQEKYEAMRKFYDDKLKEMTVLLEEKEAESEKLSEELKELDKDHSEGKEMAERLRQKQEQVARLKKKQAELTRLTAVASRNESQIARLRNEVVEMKQKKVDLQKQITSERKSHFVEVQKLKKESMQKDRELNKAKKISDKKTIEANRAQQMAKSRLEQMHQLKTKYKQTEKRLRMQTVKRGVMSKAGLDPVMVGRRQVKNESATKNKTATEEEGDDTVNVDHLRDFLDQKVADVGRREALAEKVAQEWEEHLELSIQREEITQEPEEKSEVLQSLDSQIKYKEDRIRQLASRLGKRQTGSDDSSQEEEPFLFDGQFRKLIGNSSPLVSTKIAAKVLFGMVVRERRRIASLARTASSLDERVQEAETAVASKDAAFRAYVNEQRIEAASLAQNQQEHILSLMDMVREDPTQDSGGTAEIQKEKISGKGRRTSMSVDQGNSKLLVLANERIAVLERQLNEMELGREASRMDREREHEVQALLDKKTAEREEMEHELLDLRTALRKIREEMNIDLSSPKDLDLRHFSALQSIYDIITKAPDHSSARGRSGSKNRRNSETSKRITDSPSESDEVPDWAEDIMADLAIIAEGKMPSSLLEVQSESRDVFDRLTNPESFTGVQKQKTSIMKSSKKASNINESISEGQKQRKMISKQVADSLGKVVVLSEKTNISESEAKASSDIGVHDDAENKKRSVFERLLSPSQLTGTQKQKYREKKKSKRKRPKITSLDKALEIGHITSRQTELNGENADDLLDNTLSSRGSCGSDAAKQLTSTRGSSIDSTSRCDDDKEGDVFERLTKTTTQAYAVKQQVNIAEKLLDDILDEGGQNEEEQQAPLSPPVSSRLRSRQPLQ